MQSLMDFFTNAQLWTVFFSALASFLASVGPILIARYQTHQEAERAKVAVAQAAETAKASARKDAVEEWCRLYGLKDQEAKQLQAKVEALQAQNGDQEQRIRACEENRAEQTSQISRLEGRVTKVENGK